MAQQAAGPITDSSWPHKTAHLLLREHRLLSTPPCSATQHVLSFSPEVPSLILPSTNSFSLIWTHRCFYICLPQKLRAWQDLLCGYRLPFTVHVESTSTTFISTDCNTTWENHEIKSSRKAPLNKGNGLWYNEQNPRTCNQRNGHGIFYLWDAFEEFGFCWLWMKMCLNEHRAHCNDVKWCFI